MAQFSEVVTIVNGKNQRQVENPQGKYPIYGSGGVMGYADAYICTGQTVVIGRKGSINNPIFVEEPFWNVDTAFGLVADRSALLPKYLYYFCVQFDFNKLNTTVTIPSLTKANLLEINIDMPSLEVQESVVARLDAISTLITKRREQLAKLDELVKSRFVEMFDSYYGHNEWPLNAVCNFVDYRGKTPEKSDSGVPLITAKNVKDNAFSVEPQEFIPADNYDAVMTRGFPKVNDVLFTTEAPLGNVCRIPNIYEKFCVGQRIITMQPNEGMITAEYLEYALLNKEFQDKMWQKSSGSTVKGIRSKLLEWLTIPVPPIDLQNEFTSFVEQTDKLKLTIQQSLDTLETTKKSLMQKYFG